MPSSPAKHAIYIGMGSNSHRKINLRFGLDAIRTIVSDMEVSPVVLNEAVGMQADMFFNLVVRGFCTITLDELNKKIKQIENMAGRIKGSTRVSLDIDILMYGESEGREIGISLPSHELLDAAHVLYPLALMVPNETHPLAPYSFQIVWDRQTHRRHMWPVQFDWNGRELTPEGLLTNKNKLSASRSGYATHYVCGQAVYS